jgi:hypothetical protein
MFLARSRTLVRVALAIAAVVAVALPGARAATAPFTITFTDEPPDEAASKTAVFDFTTNLPSSFTCFLDSKENPAPPCLPPVTYTGLANGRHTFAVIATATNPDGATRTTKAVRRWTINAPPETTITESPLPSETSTTATFSFTSDEAGATFECALDSTTFATCTSPTTYEDLALGDHTFSVEAVSGDRTDPSPATAMWTITTTPPPPQAPNTRITGRPATSTHATAATFSFASDQVAATFQCALDSPTFETCTSPTTYEDLSLGDHTFRVAAAHDELTDPTPATVTWTIMATPLQPPNTRITGRPATSTNATTATFSFASDQVAATFECALDSPTFATCTSPTTYEDLATGGHTFRVGAVNGDRTDHTPAAATWTIQPTTHPGRDWTTWLGVALGGVAALAAGTLTLRWRHLRLTRTREGWQLQASDDEPPKTCQAPGTYTWRRSCTATPSPWRVEGLALSDPSTNNGAREIAPGTVDWLNHALTARRTRRRDREVQDLLAPVSEYVAREIESWLRNDASTRTVELGATLSGCKFECDFTHYRCVFDGIESHWKKQDEWKGEIESTAAPVVAILEWPFATEDAREESVSRLEGDLFRFVTNADIPRKRRR